MLATKPQFEGFRSILEHREDPDFTIKAGGFEWQVHSSLFSSGSKFFEKVCSSEFKESNDRSVTLHDDNPWIVARMISWFYTGEVVFTSESTGRTTTQLNETQRSGWLGMKLLMSQGTELPNYQNEKEADAKRPLWHTCSLVYLMADKYEIAELKTKTRRLLQQSVRAKSVTIDDLVSVLGLFTLQHDENLCQKLFTAALEISGNVQATCNKLNEISAPEEKMKNIVQRVLVSNLEESRVFFRGLSRMLGIFGSEDGEHMPDGIKRKLSSINSGLPGLVAKRPRLGRTTI